MPINWDEYEKDLDEAIEHAEKVTDDKLASIVSSITRMTDEEVQELFPDPADTKKVFELMKIVKSAENDNVKVANIVKNAGEFAGIIATLLSRFT